MLVTFEPPLPAKPLQECTDAERKIGQPCWNLRAVQDALDSGAFGLVFNGSASKAMSLDLNWDSNDFRGFFRALYPGRYNDSEWCYPGLTAGRSPPLKADSYVMGYDRFRGVENQRLSPWVYMKYSVRVDTCKVIVLSVHPAKY